MSLKVGDPFSSSPFLQTIACERLVVPRPGRTHSFSSKAAKAVAALVMAAMLGGTERGRRFASRWLIVAPLRAVLPAVWILTFFRWFFGAPVDSLERGNLEEWVAEYFFEYRQTDELSIQERQELRVMVDYLAEWAHISEGLRDGTNKNVRCMRFMSDPLPAAKYRSGTVEYWYSKAPAPEDQHTEPIVFCHGLGIGLLPYIPLVRDIREAFPDRDLFCIEIPHVAMRPYPNLPSSREMCVVVADMLTAWGYPRAHMIGHSFGTIVVRWLLAHEPDRIASLTLVDPVCFLMVKNDLLLNTQRKAHDDPMGILATYLVFRELYTAHTLTRNLFWEQNNLWPEELRDVPTHVSLCGKDFILPAHSVRRLLEAEEAARQEILRDGQLNKLRLQQKPLNSR
ncbi:hypothetical protein FOL47_002812 [Perkinsus chesapeaki]|uniref:AB hydrolase-1 domain-containing protein n=1 Tax=Perkinsus chesapeaki TaxID=330153 RepID=A0A7J6MC02_PERCH|nr:hypothetical protein FOL47_002812 [Perkinsus chesapeaki]